MIATASALLLVMTDIDPQNEDAFNRWYEVEHINERLRCPGFLRARRYKTIEGSPKYLALYELESPEALKSETYLNYIGAGKTASSKKFEAQFKNLKRNVYVLISDKCAAK
jgi:hypothetical protein